MTSYLFDTNHASALLRGDAKLLSRVAAAAAADFSLCQPSVGELWYMVHSSARVAENERRLNAFLSRFPILEFDAAAGIEFGRIKAGLRRIGRPIPDVDSQIAAIAMTNGVILLSADAHFSVVTGLGVENWL